MSFPTYTGRDKRYAIVQQSAWGTEEVDGVNCNVANNGSEISTDHFDIKRGINVRQSDAAHASRNVLQQDIVVDSNRAISTFPISARAKHDEIDLFLAAFFQQVVEEATTPYKKTFTFPTTQPDFTLDAGYFFTAFERYPEASSSRKAKDCLATKLNLSIEPGGYLMASLDVVGRGAASVASNPSGTWARSPNDFYSFESMARMTIDFGAGAQDIKLVGPLNIEMSLVAVPAGHDGSGSFDTFVLINRDLKFNLLMNRDAQAITAKTNHANGTVITVNVGWGNATPGSVDGDLDITFDAIIDDVVPNNGDIIGETVSGIVAADDASTAPITIIQANAVDRAW